MTGAKPGGGTSKVDTVDLIDREIFYIVYSDTQQRNRTIMRMSLIAFELKFQIKFVVINIKFCFNRVFS